MKNNFSERFCRASSQFSRSVSKNIVNPLRMKRMFDIKKEDNVYEKIHIKYLSTLKKSVAKTNKNVENFIKPDSEIFKKKEELEEQRSLELTHIYEIGKSIFENPHKRINFSNNQQEKNLNELFLFDSHLKETSLFLLSEKKQILKDHLNFIGRKDAENQFVCEIVADLKTKSQETKYLKTFTNKNLNKLFKKQILGEQNWEKQNRVVLTREIFAIECRKNIINQRKNRTEGEKLKCAQNYIPLIFF